MPYTQAHVLTQMQLLIFSALAFTFLKLTSLYPPELPGINIDAEWTYRRFGPGVIKKLAGIFGPLDQAIRGVFLNSLNLATAKVYRYLGPKGVMARTIQAGSMVYWAVTLLAVYLVLNLI